MRVVRDKDMPDLPEGTIYCEVARDKARDMDGGFHGYSDGLCRKDEMDEDRTGWWSAELLPQPLSVDEPDGKRHLRIRDTLVTWRPIYDDPGDETEYFYVFDPEDVATLVAALGGPPPDQREAPRR